MTQTSTNLAIGITVLSILVLSFAATVITHLSRSRARAGLHDEENADAEAEAEGLVETPPAVPPKSEPRGTMVDLDGKELEESGVGGDGERGRPEKRGRKGWLVRHGSGKDVNKLPTLVEVKTPMSAVFEGRRLREGDHEDVETDEEGDGKGVGLGKGKEKGVEMGAGSEVDEDEEEEEDEVEGLEEVVRDEERRGILGDRKGQGL